MITVMTTITMTIMLIIMMIITNSKNNNNSYNNYNTANNDNDIAAGRPRYEHVARPTMSTASASASARRPIGSST